MFIASWWAWSMSVACFLGVSRLIIAGVPVRSGAERAFEWGGSYEHRTFHHADGPQVAVPPFDRVFLDEAVPAEELHAVEADPHPLLGAQLPGQTDLAGEVLAPGGAGGRLPGEQAHRLHLDGHVGDHERHRLAVADRP